MAAERGIKTVEYATDVDWALETGTWNAIPMGSILLDGTNIAEPEGFTTEMIDNIERQDGIRWSGVLRVALGTTIPAENTPFWLKVTPHAGGNAKWYGGTNGMVGRVLETGIQALSGGRAYVDLAYQFVAANGAGAIKQP